MDPMLGVAVEAARAAAKTLVAFMDRLSLLKVEDKGHYDFVTEVDRRSEQAIVRVLHKAFPEHGIVTEERGVVYEEGAAGFRWIIDPVDGTTNYIHGFPHFCISIGLEHQGVLEQAVIYDPVQQDLFTASRGKGAYWNGRRMRVGGCPGLDGALLGMGSFRRPTLPMPDYFAILEQLIPRVAGLRRSGSAALDLAYVACGCLDGFWETALKPWDIAAGILLIQEAGGLVSDVRGGTCRLDQGDIVVGNAKVLKGLLQVIQPRFS